MLVFSSFRDISGYAVNDISLPKIIKTFPRENSFTNGSNFIVKYSGENIFRANLILCEGVKCSLESKKISIFRRKPAKQQDI